jgi:signal transduction histidine kinase
MMSQTPVLIIDDEPSIREGLKEFLEDEGYDVHLAADGGEALGIFQEVYPELVVTDLRMPGMPGIEVISRIKELKNDTAVIVVTGHGTLQSAVAAIRLKVFDFIDKPIDLDQFKSTLDRARDGMLTARKVKEEMNSLWEQLALAQSHLDEYRQKMAEVEPLALAGHLVAGLLHNLTSPLSCIKGEAELLRMIHPEVENLEKIQEQARRMTQIIRTVLKKVKKSQDRQVEWLQLNTILEEEVLFLESHPFFRHEIKKEWLLADDLPLFSGNTADFGQIFGNILRNAAEAMKHQSDRKMVLRTSHNESEIIVTIQDTGPGISREIRERVFQPFFSTKIDEVGISGSFGMGLGLYSCQQLVQQYGGSIELVSSPGQGATFSIHLPKPQLDVNPQDGNL